MKVYLNVPFEEKDQAKSLGAKWNQGKRCWYFKDEVSNADAFNAWKRDSDDIPEDKHYKPIPINLNGQKYFCVNDAMDLFEQKTGAKLHNTNLGQILVKLKIKRLGYMANGSSGYPGDRWNEVWAALVNFAKVDRRQDIFEPKTPPLPECKEPLYKSKSLSSYLDVRYD